MDYQQPHGYMRPPPPPPAADPYQRPPPPVPPPPPNHPWTYSAPQFQYQPQAQHSPPPPPPPWPQSDHSQYLPPPYPSHQPPVYPGNPRYPPPHPFPPRPPHVPQSQDWAGGSWTRQQSWQYPTNNNEEDWAAKARAWAAAKAATENQQGQSQFVPAGRPEEQNHFHDQYSQPVEPQPLDGHTLAPAPNYQPYPVGHPSRTSQGHMQDSPYMSSGQPLYASGMHLPFAARDGGLAGDSVAPSLQPEKSSISPLVHQQEVPSSYSSVAGKDDFGDRYEKLSNSASLPVISVSQHQSILPAGGRSGWMEGTHNLLGSQPAEPVTDLSDQPLNFAPHFNRDMDPHASTIYTHSSGGPGRGGDPSAPISSNYAWNPSTVPGAVYPSVPPTIPTGPQVDHPITIPSPVSGHSSPMFPAGSGFQPTVPMIGSTFGVGTGVTSHPVAFSGDAYGVSDRPKKASVPNWLREEIIKKKAVITSSNPAISKEDSQSIDEDSIDKSHRKGDQADSKSIDSSKSTEDEDEDEVEATRTAAINKEIKRVLTEVLLKVTDELFDEIATEVLKEDLSVEVGQDMDIPDNNVLPSTPFVSTPKASAKVLISAKTKENDNENSSEKSISGSAGDILGLASYASDEEDEEVQSSSKLNSKENAIHQQSSSSKLLEDNPVVKSHGSQEETEKQGNFPAKSVAQGIGRRSPASVNPDCSVADTELNDDWAARGLASSDNHCSSRGPSRIAEDELHQTSDVSKLRNYATDTVVEGNERLDGNMDARSLTNDDSQIQNARNKSDKNDRLESKKSLVKKDRKDSESTKERLDKKGDAEQRRHEDRHIKDERIDYPDNSNDKGKEKGRTNEKSKHTESRKRPSPSTGKEGSEMQRDKRTTLKNDNGDKRHDRTGNEKEERSRHKSGSESSRHRRHHSSDESSDDSKRKSRHSRRRRSPSPVRSRKRQVSRSPHSKHSKRRHSPYSSLETARGKRSPSRSRSRSRSPVHRRR